MERLNTLVCGAKPYVKNTMPPVHLLVFPIHLDILEMQDAINYFKPIAVIPPWDDSAQTTLQNACVARATGAPIGVVASGRHINLIRFIAEALSLQYAPIVVAGHTQQHLWNIAQQHAFSADGWYHYCSNEPHTLDLPGRWTWGADFVGALDGGTE